MDHFIYYFNKKYKKQVHISSKFMARLYNHDWPGNIRELRNFVERYVALTGPEEISEEDFNNMLFSQREQNEEMSSGQEDKEGSIPSHWKLAFDSMPLKIAQHKLEEEMIKRAYEQTGSIAKAAARLGIDRSTIHRKLKNKAINL
jgi:DNA-binding NtrC family response regulator